MSDGRRQRFVWGRLRVIPGWAQMALAGAAVVALLAVGSGPGPNRTGGSSDG